MKEAVLFILNHLKAHGDLNLQAECQRHIAGVESDVIGTLGSSAFTVGPFSFGSAAVDASGLIGSRAAEAE